LIDWLFESSGAPVLRERAQGDVEANAPAAALLDGTPCPDMVTALRRISGDTITGAEVEQALERARRGEQVELTLGDDARLLLLQGAPGRAAAVMPVRARETTTPDSPPARDDRVARASHELANALGSIAGWARLARQGERTDEALELIEKSADSAWRAARRLLGESSGKEVGEREGVDFSSFVDEAARMLGPRAEARRIHVRTVIEPGLRVAADRGSAWSIVWNLAANAVEALPEGGTVEIRVSSAGDKVVLGVEDNGPGMSEEEQRRAFEPYFTTKAAGTGLGLPTVRQACEELGGKVELRSRQGLGTRFSVVLPRLEDRDVARSAQQNGPRHTSYPENQHPQQQPRETQRSHAKRSSGVFYAEPIEGRILVVDDDEGLREMIATALGMRGAEVVAVDTPEAALREQGPFLLAVVDLLLPGMRGDALVAALRARGVITRAMLVTGTELPEDVAEAGRPDMVLRKPFELEDLFERLADLLHAGADQSAAG
jgi:signal transduction histidine kinase/CheY-like chemotaxis protein